MTPEQIAAKLTKAQREALERVCRTNGGGLRIACSVLDDGSAVPSNGPLRKLYEKGLIQGKSGAWEMVVHTRDGLAVQRVLKEKG